MVPYVRCSTDIHHLKIIVLGGCSVLLDKRGVLCPDSNLQGGVAKLIGLFSVVVLNASII
jgi:hypothetical protein